MPPKPRYVIFDIPSIVWNHKQSHCLCLPGRDEGANRLLASAEISGDGFSSRGEALSYVGGLKRKCAARIALARLRISSFR